MVIKIVIFLLVLVSETLLILLVKGSISDADKELEDEEQMRYLEEWRKRKGK